MGRFPHASWGLKNVMVQGGKEANPITQYQNSVILQLDHWGTYDTWKPNYSYTSRKNYKLFFFQTQN